MTNFFLELFKVERRNKSLTVKVDRESLTLHNLYFCKSCIYSFIPQILRHSDLDTRQKDPVTVRREKLFDVVGVPSQVAGLTGGTRSIPFGGT